MDQFYGDRSGNLEDPFGHAWTIATHKEDVSPEEIEKHFVSLLDRLPEVCNHQQKGLQAECLQAFLFSTESRRSSVVLAGQFLRVLEQGSGLRQDLQGLVDLNVTFQKNFLRFLLTRVAKYVLVAQLALDEIEI